MKHLKAANAVGPASPVSCAVPASQLCYIFIDWGGCDSVDQCGTVRTTMSVSSTTDTGLDRARQGGVT